MKMLSGFRDFVARGNAVDLAVGVVIGAAFSAIINSLITNILNPLIAAIFGKADLVGLWHITVRENGPGIDDDTIMSVGGFLDSVLHFVLIAASVYFFVVVPMNRYAARRKKAEPPVEMGPTELELLTDIRNSLRKRKV